MKNILFIVVLVLSITACKEKVTKPEGPTQMEQVVAVHDELMPQMSTIARLIDKIEESIDTANVDSTKMVAVQNLKDANQQMTDWMIDFSNNFDSSEVIDGKELSEEKAKTLEAFQKSVNELKSKMESAIADGEKLLQDR